METKTRRKFSSEEKVILLKEHFLSKKPVSSICEENGIHPTLFYKWQAKFFDNSVKVFDNDTGMASREKEKKISELEAKLTRKNEVLSELMEEHVSLKKRLGAN